MNAAAPDGAPPRRINDGNVMKLLALPCLGETLRAGNHHNIMDFHCSGVNARSCAFQQSLKTLKGK